MRKKVDDRIRALIENIQKTNHRSFFVVVGDRGRDQVVNLYYLMTKLNIKQKKKVLWCYKKELGFSSHKTKRMREIHKLVRQGLYDNSIDEPFDVFIASSEIRYCYYKETQNVLGQTFGMLILQDFESLTPDILCRTIETVEGGGVVFLLMKSMTSLKQMYTMAMDAHKRYRTDAHQDVEPRFNERFMLSLTRSENVLFMDDEMNLLTISSKMEKIRKIKDEDVEDLKKQEIELTNLKNSLAENDVVGPLVSKTLTLDQAKAVMTYVDVLNEGKSLSILFLQASRGRGKSAAMGFGLAAALAKGMTNIFVTAPTPDNLKTFFEFAIVGLEALGFQKSLHFEVIKSGERNSDPVVRINFYAKHKQIVQYFEPIHAEKLQYAELLIIDEAAAIPLPLVKKMIGNWPIFISSTVHGYEGTGRSLSLKLVKEMRQNGKSKRRGSSVFRPFKEVKMEEPIRYGRDDPIEKWLYELLCLNATTAPGLKSGLPHPKDCDLYLVNKDTLFSYNKSSESFLSKLMSLFVSSHYKNSPNDLQMLSDCPSHSILVLLGPITKSNKGIPDILCAVQISLEGSISTAKIVENTTRGIKPAGDLIPWTLKNYFLDDNFPKLNGLRVVRIATHPQAQGMGYGSKSLELLKKFFLGELVSEKEQESFYSYNNYAKSGTVKDLNSKGLNSKLKPTKNLKPLLKNVIELKPPKMHYLGVAFGLTKQLFKFWKKNLYEVVYVKQKSNSITGENSCIMLQDLKNQRVTEEIEISPYWLKIMKSDFEKRFVSLLGFTFRHFPLGMSLDILNARLTTNKGDKFNENEMEETGVEKMEISSREELRYLITLLDLKRLKSYTNNIVDLYMIRDLIPNIAKLYFLNCLDNDCRLSRGQACLLMGLGLQFREIEDISDEMEAPVNQALALFNKCVKRICKQLSRIYEQKHRKNIEKTFGNSLGADLKPVKGNLGKELQKEGKTLVKKMREGEDGDLDQKMLKKRKKQKSRKLEEKKTKKFKGYKNRGEKYEVNLDLKKFNSKKILKGKFQAQNH